MTEPMDVLPNKITVELFDVGDEVPIGYGFAVAGENKVAQVQRWILLRTDPTMWLPRRQIRMQFPKDPLWQHGDLPVFLEKVKRTFEASEAGMLLYVKANCKRVINRSTLSEDDLDPPGFPPAPPKPNELQADIGTCQIRSGNVLAGYLSTFDAGTAKRHEYWALFPAYQPPATPRDAGGTVQNVGRAIEDPKEFAKLLNTKSWSDQATLVIASCQYYDQLPNEL